MAPVPDRPRGGYQVRRIVVKVGNTDVANFDEMVAAVRRASGPTPFVVKRTRRAAAITTAVDVTPTQRYADKEKGRHVHEHVGAGSGRHSRPRGTTR